MIRFYFVIAIAIFIGSSIGFVSYYYNSTQKKIQTLTIENTQLQSAVEKNEKTIDTLIIDIESIRVERGILDNQFKLAQAQVELLKDKLSEHDLEYLANKKPQLVENIVNDSTDDVNRCFEILSGSPLTLEEIDATKPSDINTSCPSIANPNYSPN
jgi:predicted nuclease with TOPRIM domain